MGRELLRIFEQLEIVVQKIERIEKKLETMDEKLDLSISIQRNHLIRVKNQEPMKDEMILLGKPYNDLSPEDAYAIYSENSMDFIFLDVSSDYFQAPLELDSVIKIPLENLYEDYHALVNNKTPILIISEDGLKSILACEFLVKKGYFNVNNISGGYRFWPQGKKISNIFSLAERKNDSYLETEDQDQKKFEQNS
jgi:rhodanese-related sulfurtransferase